MGGDFKNRVIKLFIVKRRLNLFYYLEEKYSRPDSNRHILWTPPPQDGVSTNSTT